MREAIGIDVGGSSIKYGLVREDGQVREAGQTELPPHADRAALESVLRPILQRFLPHAAAVGAGLPGAVSGVDGEVLICPPQLEGLRGWRVAAWLRSVSGLPAAADNDATVAALGESLAGGFGEGSGTLFLATLGTGLGGGIVIDGRPLRGRFGTGGEIGHAIFEPRGLRTPKHAPGAFELYASATALLRRYRERGGTAEQPREVAERAEAGEVLARESVAAVGTDLGIGLASVAALIAPDVFLIGGGLSVLGELLLTPTRAAYREHALPLIRDAEIRLARLGNQAGLVGAGLLALRCGV